jgi:hypothetical protein
MGAFRAVGLSPSISSIDADVDNVFSWVTQGGVQISYCIYIYDNTTSALVYTSYEIISSNQHHTLPAHTLTNAVDYNWDVVTETIIGDSDSESEFFTCAANPTVTFAYPSFTSHYTSTVETFAAIGEWEITDCIITTDTNTYNAYYGTQTIKLKADSVSGDFYMSKYGTFVFDEFKNGSTSSTSDSIRVIALCEEDDQVMRIKMGNDDGYYYHDFTMTTGIWTYEIDKESFVSSGSPSWHHIEYVSIGLIGSYSSRLSIYFQRIELFSTGTGLDATFNYQDNIFYLNYVQAEEVGIKNYKFILYDENQVEITDTGWIYDLLLQYEFTGLLNDTTYYIEGIITSQYDQTGTTGLKTFLINYSNNIVLPEINATADDDQGTVTIDWSNINFTTCEIDDPGYVAGKFNYGLSINDGAYVTFNQDIPETYTFTFWIKIRAEFSGIIFEVDGNQFGFSNSLNQFYYIKNGIYFYSEVTSLMSFIDFGTDTWSDCGSSTWLTIDGSTSTFLSDYLFIGLTTTDFIVKKSNNLIAHISLV